MWAIEVEVQTEAIAAHKGAPGHHFQIARAQELPNLPKFQRFGGYGANSEGWGLYSERLADEMGVYTSPEQRFGMLSLQMWRAIRLVLDIGIHSKRWSREQAIAHFRANSPNSERFSILTIKGADLISTKMTMSRNHCQNCAFPCPFRLCAFDGIR